MAHSSSPLVFPNSPLTIIVFAKSYANFKQLLMIY